METAEALAHFLLFIFLLLMLLLLKYHRDDDVKYMLIYVELALSRS
jgi:hypothetical protein